MYQPRVFIADDHPLVLEGFRQLLAHDTVIVGTAHSGAELLEKVQQGGPGHCVAGRLLARHERV